ncbi:MAG: DUF3667 domain-containing protein [Planctomycetes bacterium]|nr:DUF3667 domain-containing protein [Planctomycetota bacterium]
MFGKTVADLVHLDQVLLRTGLSLLWRPGALVADVLRGRTRPYTKPIATMLIFASSYFLLLHWSGLSRAVFGQDMRDADPMLSPMLAEIMRETMQWGQYLNLINVPLAAVPMWLLDGSGRRPYGHWVLFVAYTVAGTSLIATLLLVICLGQPAWYTVATAAQLPGMALFAAWTARGAFGFGWLRGLFAVGLPLLVVASAVGAAFGLFRVAAWIAQRN